MFEYKLIDNVIQVNISGPLSEDSAKALIGETKTYFETNILKVRGVRDFVVNFHGSTSISKEFLDLLPKLSTHVLACGKILLASNLTDDLQATLRSHPNGKLLPMLAGDKSKSAINADFINPFINGTVETLKIQCQISVKSLKPYAKKAGETVSSAIAGIIGLTSQHFNGSIAICFPKETFLGVMGQMLGEKYTEITQELEDGAGEILNIIFGHAKTALNKNNLGVEKAIPTVVRGDNVQIKHVSRSTSIILPFETSVGPFHIEVGVEGESMTAKKAS